VNFKKKMKKFEKTVDLLYVYPYNKNKEKEMKTVKFEAFYWETVKGGADKDNFFTRSTANFVPCQLPETSPDFTSESGSRYWYTDKGVVRGSDHWGGVATCRWTLDGTEAKNPVPVAGFCRWEDFELAVMVTLIAEFPAKRKIKLFMNYNGRRVVLNQQVE
jgi:hypothetical protein